MTPPASRLRLRGFALLMTLVVVLLVSAYVTEVFFATGLELRAVQTFKDSQRAQELARAAFKVAQIGLLLDEVEFFKSFAQMQSLLTVASLPWEDGLLIDLRIEPLDARFNLNEFVNIQPGQSFERARWGLFLHILRDAMPPAPTGAAAAGAPPPPSDYDIGNLYAALFDWIDQDTVPYTELTGVQGAEAAAYHDRNPEYEPRNGPLTRLAEIRLVRGVAQGAFPWQVWEERFAVLPPRGAGKLYPERLNVNRATHDEIVAFLQRREMDGAVLDAIVRTPAFKDIQEAINTYAANAAEIADVLLPLDTLPGTPRVVYTDATLKAKLGTPELAAVKVNANYVAQVFSTYDEFYRIALTTEVNGVQARLEAVLNVPRNAANRTGTSSKVLFYTLH
ncbi:MAG: general secretion pathway protein GspK [Candidatus Lambdaproteobacteria bacterium]|nr:general secretion pathway protein GspK [Candidatus Lambdaproteobacteria bacterium]